MWFNLLSMNLSSFNFWVWGLVWFFLVCFWMVVVMKNIYDVNGLDALLLGELRLLKPRVAASNPLVLAKALLEFPRSLKCLPRAACILSLSTAQR